MPSGIKTLLSLFGAVLFSLMTLAMLIMGLVWGDQMVASILLALLFGGTAAFLTTIAVRSIRSPGRADTSAMSQERARVLRLAASKQGRLTAEETALGAHISVQQAQALLDEMVIAGTADTWISDSGRMVYVFGSFVDGGDKLTAEDPLKLLDP